MRRLLLAAIALLAMAAPATAAKPHKGARYVGFEGSETQLDDTVVSAKVRVSGSGRRFRRGSYVNLTACGEGRKVSLARTAIRRSGRFSKSKRHGRFRYRLRGRFVMREYARVSYSASRSRRSGGGSKRCASGRVKVALYEKGVPPFKGCRSQRAYNEVKDTHGRVFDQLRFDSSLFAPFAYGCLYSENKRFPLGRNWGDEFVEVPRLAAPYVAWSSARCGGLSCDSTVEVRDLRDGKLIHDGPATTGGLSGNGTTVTDLVIKSNGSVAWIVDIGSSVGSNRQVVAVDSAGRRTLDSGGTIDPASLTLSGSTLSWTKGGVPRSASLN